MYVLDKSAVVLTCVILGISVLDLVFEYRQTGLPQNKKKMKSWRRFFFLRARSNFVPKRMQESPQLEKESVKYMVPFLK